MSSKRYTEEFRIAAVKQFTEGGHSVGDVARRLGVTTKSLSDWKEKCGESATACQEKKAELKRFRRSVTSYPVHYQAQPASIHQAP
jgi:transposase